MSYEGAPTREPQRCAVRAASVCDHDDGRASARYIPASALVAQQSVRARYWRRRSAYGSRLRYQLGPSGANERGDRFTGRYTLSQPRTLLLTDAYDDRWSLVLDDGLRVRARRANADENEFSLPAGTHRFVVAFTTSPVDRTLGFVAGAVWPTVSIATIAFALARRPRSLA